MGKKLYTINLDIEKNILFVKTSGVFKEEDAKVYISEFQTTVNTINPSKYKFIIDTSEQEAVETHVIDDIRFVLNQYSSAHFKEIVVINPICPISKRQIADCVNELNFKGEFVDSLKEAFK
ncbi:hypothetical protein [Neobacillus jeddahensis]|uniref:hypothetical protein n=1 Tax=Neobacillus jeddahensis TaxID=1461580 RepID=UPI00058CCDCC|nr:hypothetical protein [Neobacillus jeddahensis]